MRDSELRRIIGQIVVAAIPTLALTTACRTTGEATYVVRSSGRPCREACATLAGTGERGSWRASDVMECVDATEVDPAAPSAGPEDGDEEPRAGISTPVAVCRMRTHYTGGIGRRPTGLVLDEVGGTRREGAFFARVEQLERAAVIAFQRTERELRAHGAPRSLVLGARRARIEEVRHAEIASRWRKAFGGTEAALGTSDLDTPRSLAALAEENATEGCVHEHWGAILAVAQAASVRATRAPDDRLAVDLRVIARDEVSHAALSRRIDRWAHARLPATARHAIASARARAVAEIASSLDEGPDELPTIGWPDGATRARLFHAARETLGWSVAA